MRNKCILALALMFVFTSLSAQQQDKLLGILKKELKYNFEQLQKQPQKPYFMSYRAEDSYSHVISSSFGTAQANNEKRQRLVTPQIRLGDKTLDNFKYNSQGMQSRDGRSATTVTIPFDDNATEGITTNIWNATLSRYKYAVAAYEQARSKAATSTENEDKAPCFSDAKAEVYYEEPYDLDKIKIDGKAWQKRLDEVSAVFKADPSLKTADVSLNYRVQRTYFVNTDGTEIVQNHRSARIMLSVSAIADDGMQLPLNEDFFAFNPDELPSQNVIVAAAKDLLERIQALKKAPVANPYTGPAILSGAASGVFFHEIFGHRLEGHRMKKGGETFKDMVGKEVLPQPFQVYCDPTLKQYAGTDMNGHYLYDSEGVKARRVDNVVDGVLKGFLMSRVPLDGFPESNGHGRTSGGNDPVSRQSNLVIETTKPYTDSQLRDMLIAEARKQEKEYGYFFKTVTSGFTLTGDGGSINSFNVTPVEVYRVYTDGRPDELVRGVSMIGTPLAMFSHIVAGGDTPSVFTGSCGAESGWVPVTASSPAIFVSQIETQRAQNQQALPNILPAPAFTQDKQADDNIIFSAMKDELKRTTDSLTVAGLETPFYASYIVNRYRSFSVTGELGAISASSETPFTYNASVHLAIGNFKRSSDFPGQPLIVGTPTAIECDYSSLRRTLWESSDMAYKNTVNMMAQKQNMLAQYPLPAALEKIPDLQRSAPTSYLENEKEYNVDMKKMEDIAKQLSAVFKNYKYLFNTEVKINGNEITSFRSTSEDVNLKLPHNSVVIKVSATFEDDNRVKTADNLTLHYENPDEIPSIDALVERVRKFADDCMEMRNAPVMEEYYKGPVMYEDEAAKQIITATYLAPDQFYGQQNFTENPKSLGQKLGKKIIDERISIVNSTDKTEYNGEKLYGHYQVDADGFKPEAELSIVEKGVFKTMLNRTTPAMYAEKSTANSRLANSPAQSIPLLGVGTLIVKAEGTTKDDNMLKTLLKTAKKQKLDYAYVITTPRDYTSLRLYKVDVKTGERKLVKHNRITLPTESQMKKFAAISDRPFVSNNVQPYTYSTITPASIIVGDAELTKPVLNGGKASELVYPLQR